MKHLIIIILLISSCSKPIYVINVSDIVGFVFVICLLIILGILKLIDKYKKK